MKVLSNNTYVYLLLWSKVENWPRFLTFSDAYIRAIIRFCPDLNHSWVLKVRLFKQSFSQGQPVGLLTTCKLLFFVVELVTCSSLIFLAVLLTSWANAKGINEGKWHGLHIAMYFFFIKRRVKVVLFINTFFTLLI